MTIPTDEVLRRRGLLLEYLTIGWNVAEAVIAVAAGAVAGSIALVGFGFDSTIEIAAASVVVWQFRAELRRGVDERRQRRALRMVATTFFVLGGYVTVEAVRDLAGATSAEPSPVGIVLASVSLVVMPVLAWSKRRIGGLLNSRTLVADSVETFLCAWLSVVLLAGLVLNAAAGWAWADPAAALAIAVLAVREGVEAWRGGVADDG